MNLKLFFKRNKFIILLLFIVFILRLPSLFEPYWYGDEGVYLTVGLAIRKGFLLYRDIFDNKTPLIYLLTAAANGTIFWFRLFLLSSVLTTIYFFYRLSQKLMPKNDRAAKIATGIFALLTTTRWLEGNIANAELFILLPVILGFYFFFSKDKQRNFWHNFSLGLLLGLGLLFKAPALFDFAALGVFLVLFQEKKFFSFGRREIALVAGYLLPLFLTSLFFWFRGIFGLFFQTCFVQTMGYLSSWETGIHTFSLTDLLRADLALKGLLVLALLVLFLSLKKKLNNLVLFSFLWFTFTLLAATLSGRPYPHYLVPVIPPFSLIVSSFWLKKNKITNLLSLGLILLLGLTIARYRFWSYPTLSYYQNFLLFAFQQKSKDDYFSYFDNKIPQIYSLAKLISESSFPEERIFVWADEPYLYALSRRLPATPYVAAYHVLDLHKEKETLTQLSQDKPALIIIDQKTKKFPQLESLVNRYYRKMETLGSFTVFLKKLS